MSFGWTAAAWVAIGTTTVAAGSAAYSADANRKAMHEQQSALKASQEADAREAAEAETGAQVAANAKLAEVKRRRRSSSLQLGGSDETFGNAGGAPVLSRPRPGGFAPAATVLGGGGAMSVRRTPTQSY